jgi:hypothetical protein
VQSDAASRPGIGAKLVWKLLRFSTPSLMIKKAKVGVKTQRPAVLAGLGGAKQAFSACFCYESGA